MLSLFEKSNLRVQRNNTLNLECIEVHDQFLVTLLKEKASNLWIQEEIAGFECLYKSSSFLLSYPDYPWCNYERELLYLD